MRLNRLILKLGHGQMHATVIMIRYQAGSDTLSVLNAGHPAPLLVYPAEAGKKPKPIIARSDLLGLNSDFTCAMEEVPFEQGTSVLLYTDGLTEGRPDHKLYSDRRLAKACIIPGHLTINQLVLKVQEDWTKYLEGMPASDDLCLMAVRRS
jgi:serine phosphatase RsbU (regulator of sigma subunit)